MHAAVSDRWETNPAAYVHRMLNGDQGVDLRSVIDPVSDDMITDTAEVKRVLHHHYSEIFSPSVRPSRIPPWLASVTIEKAGIDPAVYDRLMIDVTADEIGSSLRSGKPITAPGRDGLSTGVWRFLCRSPTVTAVVRSLLNSWLRLRMMPACGKQAIIVPLLKKRQVGPFMTNLRPISLQSSLCKLLTRILARRLGAILSSHAILHPAQRGFLPSGQSQQCIDAILDAWEHAHENGQDVFNLFYDIQQAYDSVRHDDLVAALRRLRMPAAFVDLVRDSLTGLTSCVRTAYGSTADFPVDRSIRQGDPLAPLLFICWLDHLHCGFECNPLHPGVKDGFFYPKEEGKIHGLCSQGFADDTVIISSSYEGLCWMHCWAVEWAQWHCVRFHPDKSILVGMSRGVAMTNSDIVVGGLLLPPYALDACFRYLGATLRLDMCTSSAAHAITSKIVVFCNAIEAHRLRADRAVWAINTFLIPSLAYGMSFVNALASHRRKWDVRVAAAVSRCMGERGARKVSLRRWHASLGSSFPHTMNA